MKKVSVIIPCYNAADCIDRCVETLVRQTIGMESLELIFVNDASTDQTFEKLCEWEKKYPDSIMVINCEENGRQGRARNIGMEYASADYIGFCDNDDMVEGNMFELLYQAAKFQDSDLVVCRSKKYMLSQLGQVQMKRTAEDDFYFEIKNISQRKAFLDLNINRAIWNKLYRRDMILANDIKFAEGMIYDDICFSELVKHYANKIYVLEEEMYHHIISDSSASYDSESWKNRIGYFDANVLLVEELRRRGLYDRFAERYETNYIFELATIIKAFALIYGYFPPGVFDDMNERTNQLFPRITERPTYRKIINAKSDNSDYLALNCIGRAITKEDMDRIRDAVKREQGIK